jgi:hypothetical protein
MHLFALIIVCILYTFEIFIDLPYWIYAMVYLPGWILVLFNSYSFKFLNTDGYKEIAIIAKEVFLNSFSIIPAIFLTAYSLYYARLELSLFAVDSYEIIVFLFSLSTGMLLPLLTAISKRQLNSYLSSMEDLSFLNRELKYILWISLPFIFLSFVFGPWFLKLGFSLQIHRPFLIIFFIVQGLIRYFLSVEMNILHVVRGTFFLSVLTSLPPIMMLVACFFLDINTTFKFIVMLHASTLVSLISVYIFGRSSQSFAQRGALYLFLGLSAWLLFY